MDNREIAIFKEMNEENRKKKKVQLKVVHKPIFKRVVKKRQPTVDQLVEQIGNLGIGKSKKLQKQHGLIMQRLKKQQKKQKLQQEIEKINRKLGALTIPKQKPKENNFMKRLNELAFAEAQMNHNIQKTPSKRNRLLMLKLK